MVFSFLPNVKLNCLPWHVKLVDKDPAWWQTKCFSAKWQAATRYPQWSEWWCSHGRPLSGLMTPPSLPSLHLLEFFQCSCEEDEVYVPPMLVTPNILEDWTRTMSAETVYYYYHHDHYYFKIHSRLLVIRWQSFVSADLSKISKCFTPALYICVQCSLVWPSVVVWLTVDVGGTEGSDPILS